jgi:uncharacterized protein (DUF427 family)
MKSPGHREHPEHKVNEKHLDRPMEVVIGGAVVAESRDVIEVDEDGSPPRFYFPRSDVRMDMLRRSETTSKCPYKGTAHYFGVRDLADVVWSYEEPYEEHSDLKDRLAFWSEKSPAITIAPA